MFSISINVYLFDTLYSLRLDGLKLKFKSLFCRETEGPHFKFYAQSYRSDNQGQNLPVDYAQIVNFLYT